MEETVSDNDDDNDNNEDVIDDLFDVPSKLNIQCYTSLTTLDETTTAIHHLEMTLQALVRIEQPTFENMLDAERYDLELKNLKRNYFYLVVSTKQNVYVIFKPYQCR